MIDPKVYIGLGVFGECLPRWENYVEIDRDRVDAFGIPVLKIHMTYGENERAMIEDMGDSAGEMLEAAGARTCTSKTKCPRPVGPSMR